MEQRMQAISPEIEGSGSLSTWSGSLERNKKCTDASDFNMVANWSCVGWLISVFKVVRH